MPWRWFGISFQNKVSKLLTLLAICILESIFFTPISYYGLNDSNMLRTFKDTQLSHKMVQMWVNFAKVSNPTPSPEEDGPLKKLVWQPYVLEKNGPILNFSNHMNLENIDDEETVKRIDFWKEIFDELSLELRPPIVHHKMYNKRQSIH